LQQQQVEAQIASLNQMLDAASEYKDILGESSRLTAKQQTNRTRVLDAMGYFYNHAAQTGRHVTHDELLRRAVLAEFGDEITKGKETALKNRLQSAKMTRTAP